LVPQDQRAGVPAGLGARELPTILAAVPHVITNSFTLLLAALG
jgi:hypothetical protein